MGLTVTVKGDQGVDRYEFSALNLAQFISALYNHQENPQDNTQLSVAQAQQKIQKFDGSRHIQLHRLKNDAGHQRNLGLTIEGRWKGQTFTPTKITIEEKDYLKGGINKGVRRRGKNQNDAKPIKELVEALHEQNKAPEIRVPRNKLKDEAPRIKQKRKNVKREMSPSLKAAHDRGLYGADSPEPREEKPYYLSPSLQAAYSRSSRPVDTSPEVHREKEMSPSLIAAHTRGEDKATSLDWSLGEEHFQEEEGRELLKKSNDGLRVPIGTPPLEVSDYSSSSQEQDAQLGDSLDFVKMLSSSEEGDALRRSSSPLLEEGDERIAPMFGRAVDSEELNRKTFEKEKQVASQVIEGRKAPPPSPQSLHREMGRKVHFSTPVDDDSSSSEENKPVIRKRPPAKPRRNPSKSKTQLNNTNHGWLSYLKWPVIMAGLTYGAVRALEAAKLVTVAAISTVSAVAAGIAFVVTGIYQAWRESFKKSSFAGVSQGKNTVEELSDTLSKLPANAYQSFKHGIEGNKSIFNQFKSCFRPSDYSRSYYAGYHLAEREPNFDLEAVDKARNAKPGA